MLLLAVSLFSVSVPGDEPPSSKAVGWRVYRGCLQPREPLRFGPGAEANANWQLTDSLGGVLVVPAGSTVVISADSATGTLVLSRPLNSLTEQALQAVEMAPGWCRWALAANLSQLPEDLQNAIAQMIISPPDERWRDELAFEAAYTSYTAMTRYVFSPQLLMENVRYLYELDDSLDYVQIVDFGDSSTTVYRIVDLDGDTVDYQLPAWAYYWLIVHPQLSDETPRMDYYVYDRWWRDFFSYYAEWGYPLLIEKLRPVKVALFDTDTPIVLPGDRDFSDTACAVDVIANWVTKMVPNPAEGNRPIQPNVIVMEHNGNCGELQDALAAAGRTGLIPTTSMCTIPEDHVWNEFYLMDRWYPWQVDLGGGVTHINDPRIAYDRDRGGSKEVTTVFEWRSGQDGPTRTATYSQTCSLYVWVYDSLMNPLEGTRLVLYGDWNYGVWWSGWYTVGQDGLAKFELGDSALVLIRAYSPLGNFPLPYDTVSYSTEPDQVYEVTLVAEDALPILQPSQMQPDTTQLMKLVVEIPQLEDAVRGYGRTRDDCASQPYNSYYYRMDPKGILTLMVLDDENYQKYLNGEDFSALYFYEDTTAGTYEFILPASRKWHLILSNEKRLASEQVGQIKVYLYYNGQPPDVAESPAHLPGLKVLASPSKRPVIVARAPRGGELRVYSADGRLVLQKPVVGTQRLSLSLKPGVYWAVLDAGRRFKKSLVVF